MQTKALILLALLLTSSAAFAGPPQPVLKSAAGAHRGGGGLWPESTLYAYQQCAQRWPDLLLEGDVHVSKDGVLVMIHDATVDRTTNGTGLVHEMTLEELQALDAGYRFKGPDDDFPHRGKGIRIPTFAEVLAACPDHQFLIELKNGEGVAEKMIALLREAGATSRVTLASFNPIHMARCRELAPEVATCFDPATALEMLTELRSPDWSAYVPPSGFFTFSPGLAKQLGASPKEFAALREKGVLVQVHTVNQPEAIREYLAMGIDSILSDYPDRVYEAIAERDAAKTE